MAQKPPLLRCNRPSLQSVSSCKMYLSILQMCLSNLQNVFVQCKGPSLQSVLS